MSAAAPGGPAGDDAKYPELEEATMMTANGYTTTPSAALERSERITTNRLGVERALEQRYL